MRDPAVAVIALGANLGDPVDQVEAAIQALADQPEIELIKVSGLYLSPAFQCDGPDFVNAVAQVQTTLTAFALLGAMADIEQRAGRQRPHRWAPRTLDLDLIFFGAASIDGPKLSVPHPRWEQRAFVVQPLMEVEPNRVSQSVAQAVSQQSIQRIKGRA